MKVLYDTVYKATFIERRNRFVVSVALDGIPVLAHLPNPGRMWELLFTGVTMYIVPHDKVGAKTQYRVIGIDRDGIPIMLDTHYSNDVAEYLLSHQLIPGWEAWSVVRREYTVGHSRFDLLLTNAKKEQFLLEVKSCTLFSERGAMFPDAITERGRKHLLHLEALQQEGYHTGVLFLVQWEKAEWFLPDYHTDLAFATTFQQVAPHLDWKAVALRWNEQFTMPHVVRLCHYEPAVVAQEAKDAGDYMIVMHLPTDASIAIGNKGIMFFKEGYYMYVGSAKANLRKRIERHTRKRKKMHWHLDYFRGHCEIVATIPVRTASDLECELAQTLKAVTDWSIPGFGCSDCQCESHLFGMQDNPIHNKLFMKVVEDMRMNRLDSLIER